MKQNLTFRWAFLFMALVMAANLQATGYLGSADTAIYNILWKVVNFISGIVGIMLMFRIIWALQNTEDRGAQLKTAAWNLVILGLVWGLGSWWLSTVSQSGTSMQGVDQAMQMHP
jgi:hypothetical protein